MLLLKSLRKPGVEMKLSSVSFKRSFISALFFVFFLPIYYVLSLILDFSFICNNICGKYYLFLFVISLIHIFLVMLCNSSQSKIFLYRSFYTLSGIIIICLSHMLYLQTGSLILYFAAAIYVSIVPVFTLSELKAASLICLFAAITYLVSYHGNNILLFQVIMINIFLIALTVSKYTSIIGNITAYSKLDKELNKSVTDPLTGLLNRRGLERKVNITWPLCSRHGISTAIIMIDIDFFKKYNDTFGHPQGDRCIKAIGSVLKNTARRASDISSRIGGEEFMIFVQDISKEDLLLLAKRIQRGVENLKLTHATNVLSQYVTVSIGIAHIIPDDNSDFNTLYEKADKALYHAKENGRNCISLNNCIYSRPFKKDEDSFTTPYGQLKNTEYYSKVAK